MRRRLSRRYIENERAKQRRRLCLRYVFFIVMRLSVVWRVAQFTLLLTAHSTDIPHFAKKSQTIFDKIKKFIIRYF